MCILSSCSLTKYSQWLTLTVCACVTHTHSLTESVGDSHSQSVITLTVTLSLTLTVRLCVSVLVCQCKCNTNSNTQSHLSWSLLRQSVSDSVTLTVTVSGMSHTHSHYHRLWRWMFLYDTYTRAKDALCQEYDLLKCLLWSALHWTNLRHPALLVLTSEDINRRVGEAMVAIEPWRLKIDDQLRWLMITSVIDCYLTYILFTYIIGRHTSPKWVQLQHLYFPYQL